MSDIALDIADAVVDFINVRQYTRYDVEARIEFGAVFDARQSEGIEVQVIPAELDSTPSSRVERDDLITVSIMVIRKLEEEKPGDLSQVRGLSALTQEIFDALSLETFADAANVGMKRISLMDPVRLRDKGLFASAIQLQYRSLWTKTLSEVVADPTPDPDPEPTPDPDPDPDPDPENPTLKALPTVRYGNRFVDIGTTETFGSVDKTNELSWFYQVKTPINDDYGWDNSTGGKHVRSGAHDLSDGKTAARTRFQEFLTEVGAANSRTLRGIYWGSKNVRTDAELAALSAWPSPNSSFERDWGGSTQHLQSWLYNKGYTGSYRINHQSAAAREALLDILFGTYLGPTNLYDFTGLELFHFDEMGATDNSNTFSAAEWSGLVALGQEMKQQCAALGLRFSANLGGWGLWNNGNPWFAPNWFNDIATMLHLLQQERTPGPQASLTTAGMQRAFANIQDYVFDQGVALELHPGLIESDMWPVYTIEAIEVIEGESAWPHNVAYLRDGDRKLLVTLDQDAHAFDWIAETWGSASYIGDQATEATDPWPRSGWSIAKGPASNKVIVGRQSGDADSVLAGIGGGFAWTDLVGQHLRTATHWPRIQAAWSLMAIRSVDDTVANHSGTASNAINAYLYANSGEPGVGTEQNWMRWGAILGNPVGPPTYLGDLASGYAGRVRREFQNGRIDLEPDIGLVTISV